MRFSFRPLCEQELAENFAGPSIRRRVSLAGADTVLPSVVRGAEFRNFSEIQAITLSGVAVSLTQAATSLAIRATMFGNL
jgi:hypothetical protein